MLLFDRRGAGPPVLAVAGLASSAVCSVFEALTSESYKHEPLSRAADPRGTSVFPSYFFGKLR